MMLDHNGHRMVNRTHGLRATYNDGCRCEPCRDADRAYKRQRTGTLTPGEQRDNELDRLYDTIADIVADRCAQWREHAACRTAPVNVFYPERGANQVVDQAKSICATCPVVNECLSYARERGERSGIWAGRSMNRNLHAEPRTIPCRTCHTPFVPTGTQRLCSHACRVEARAEATRRRTRRKAMR